MQMVIGSCSSIDGGGVSAGYSSWSTRSPGNVEGKTPSISGVLSAGGSSCRSLGGWRTEGEFV
jgi:hypothetical protein